jgi:ArsR family transcriptional regulator
MPANNERSLNIVYLAQASKAAGDPLRMNILKLLGRGAFGVLELCQIFDIKQSSMSHHLKVLAQAGLVSTQREGNSIFYRRPLITATDSWSQWLRATFIAIDAASSDEDVGMAVEQVLAERAEACAEFFSRHANDFKDQQDLIASFDQYGDALATILDSLTARARNSEQAGYALEIGPGEGAFLPLLAKHFSKVTALDVSPDMLARTEATLTTNAIANVDCVLGDTAHLLANTTTTKYQFAVANMVLHHVPAPKTIFNEVAELLQPEGTLLITDLCRHDQAWAKDSCGDLWLGFDPADLTAWATEAGLIEGQSQFLGLRNGFQIQFRLFHRSPERS